MYQMRYDNGIKEVFSGTMYNEMGTHADDFSKEAFSSSYDISS